MDFSKLDDEAQWKKLRSELAGLDIGVLGEYIIPRLVHESIPRFPKYKSRGRAARRAAVMEQHAAWCICADMDCKVSLGASAGRTRTSSAYLFRRAVDSSLTNCLGDMWTICDFAS